MLSALDFPAFNGKRYIVFGGPYYNRPALTKGVKLAAEINSPADISVPTHDFDVPNEAVLLRGLVQAIDCMVRGECLYVGCMGGRGRTGLFLAALAKAWGISDPVRYVRSNYNGHAVETQKQFEYIKNLQIPMSIKFRVMHAKMKGWVPGKKRLTKIPATIYDPLRPRA